MSIKYFSSKITSLSYVDVQTTSTLFTEKIQYTEIRWLLFGPQIVRQLAVDMVIDN